MTHRRLVALCAIALTIFAASCSGPEEKKMKFFNKGKSLYEQGDYVKARLEFRNALQIDRNFARGYYMLGLIELHENNWRKAYGFFSKATEADPELWDAHAELGKLLLVANEKDKAREKVELVLSKNPNHEEALLVQAGLFIADGQEAKGTAMLESIIEKNPAKSQASLMLADIRLKTGHVPGARTVLEDLLNYDEQNKAARLLLINVLEKEKDLPGAEDAYKRLITQHPEDDATKLMLVGFYIRTNRIDEAKAFLDDMIAAKPGNIQPRLYLAQFHRFRGQDDAMEAVLKKSVQDLPDQLGAYEILARYYLEKGQTDQAIELMQRFMNNVRVGPAHLKAKVLLALIHYENENLDVAFELAEEVLAENPADMNAHFLKGGVLEVRGDFSGAIAEYRAVLQQEPQNVRASMYLAKAHLMNNEYSLAEDGYKRVLEIDPHERQARFGLVELYRRKGELAAAKKQLEKVLEVNPDDSKALMALGDLALVEADADAATGYFSRLARLQPDSIQYVSYRKGMVKLLEKNPAEAASLFEKALQADPDFVPALNQLIEMLVKEKNLDRALDRCREQIARTPGNPHYYVLLGRLHVFNNDAGGARRHFEKALEIDPNSPDALFSLAHLEQSSGSLDDALDRYQALRRRYPNNFGIGLVAAALLEKKGDFAEAKAIYKDILSKNPNVHIAANNLAFYYAEHEPTMENLAEAQELVLPLLQKYKDHPSFADTAAWLYYRQGYFAKARDIMLSVKDRIGNRPAMQYHLGMIYLNLEQKAEAKKHLELAVGSDQAFPGREEAERVLKELI